jgi:hypothetical protein
MDYVKGSLVDRYGNRSKKYKKGGKSQKIPFEELPLTFKEWEKIDNLFRNKNSTTFKTFL